MSNNTHPNSRKVTIFRANNFMQRAQKDEVADFMSMSAKSIGPYFESHSSKIIGSGLTIREQELLMPTLLAMDATDRDFKKAVYNFFNALTTKIPFSSGKDLEIGLDESNDKPLSKENLPLNLEQYVRWRHAKNHPWVAGNKDEAEGNQLKFFYIFDADTQVKEDTDKLVIQDKADGIWLQIKNNTQKVGMMLTAVGMDERDYLGRNEVSRKQGALREYINKHAVEFIEAYEDGKLETKYWLRYMLKAQVVEQLGTSYIVKENKTLLGRSEMETLIYLENPANADTVAYLKGAAQDVMRKPVTRRKVAG